MRIVIIEDEWAAQEQIKTMLSELIKDLDIISIIDSVKDGIDFFSTNPSVDLILMDIHLSDGNSFEIFKHVKITAPIIFTTAYDQYAIQAFKHNSLDYLLKPICIEDLQAAINKYQATKPQIDQTLLESIYDSLNESKDTAHKNSFLIQKKDRLYPIDVESIAAFYIDSSLVKCHTFDNEIHVLPYTMEDLEKTVSPSHFFRANRQYLLNRKAIKHLSIHFNGKLKVHCDISIPDAIIVSRLKSNELKKWLNS